jgi:hypothetical protein
MLEHQHGLGEDGRWLVDSVARGRAKLGARAVMAAGGSVPPVGRPWRLL